MVIRVLILLAVGLLNAAAETPMAASAATTSASAKPSLPPLKSLRLEPSSLVFKNGRDARKVLVTGETKTGQRIDLTSEAIFKTPTEIVSLDEEGYLVGKSRGEAKITVSAGGLSTILPVKVEDASLPELRFVHDITPVLAKIGCNAGTCHGSAKGKNGFKLSLRGYDPEFDYQALINDIAGRRFNRVKVEESLMLLKPTAEVPHEGRQVLKPGSRYYKLIYDWIAQGTKFETAEQGRAVSIELLPAEVELDLPGRSQQLIVLAKYYDGSVQDVTREAIFSSNNNDVTKVTNNVVTALRRGEAAVLVRYEGSYATKQVTVMGDRSGYQWAARPQYNFIDRQVDAKLQKMKINASDLCTDAEFIRRAYLDLTGLTPNLDRVRAFLKDGSPSKAKREKLIDELIGSPEFIDYWANKWSDLLQCNGENLGQKGVWVFRNWIHEQLEKNVPYDKLVRTLLAAQGSSFLNPEVNYLRVLREPGKMAEDISQTFLGVRFNCNKCHDHPFEKWTQNQYYEFGAYFARVGFKPGSFGSETIRNFTGDNANVVGEEIVYVKYDGGEVHHLKTDAVVKPKVPYGEAAQATDETDRREPFVDWLTSTKNPYFAKAMANRVWSYFLGRGIIDPVDDIRGSNPASNPELLDSLTEDFVKHGLDLRQLMRTICTSRTYQLAITPNKWNQDDEANFSHAKPRRLSAEQMMGAIEIATGFKPKFEGMPEGLRSVQVPDGIVKGDDFLSLFGRPKRQSACECERTSNVTLSHALNLINGNTIGEAVSRPRSVIARLEESDKDPKQLVEDIYMTVLNRPPTDDERKAVDFQDGNKRLEAAQDLAWALMNSPAFLFNR